MVVESGQKWIHCLPHNTVAYTVCVENYIQVYLLVTEEQDCHVPLPSTHLRPHRILTGPPEGVAEGSPEFPALVKSAAGSLHWPRSSERHSGCHESHSARVPQGP